MKLASKYSVCIVAASLVLAACSSSQQQSDSESNENPIASVALETPEPAVSEAAILGTPVAEQATPSLTNSATPTKSISPTQKNMTPKQWDTPPVNQLKEGKKYFATIKTNKGDIKLELFADVTPITVNNFVFLSREKFYDGVIFHRIISGFMAQGGDPTGTGMGGPGYKFEDEIVPGKNKNDAYTISMANAGPDTNGSQFFINFIDNHFLDPKHTVFGKVVGGKEVVDALGAVPTDMRDKPVQNVVIESVIIEEI